MDASRGAIEASYCRRIYGNRLSAEQASGISAGFAELLRHDTSQNSQPTDQVSCVD
ncbi:hypothetical protein M5K25_006090 [Dendrobium thyrsiflorum]|uniref:Uncharacterized protein n=1 Tax=Dendrobium thyrsiflorum TaxID=117978 RepID=A0ABD0VAY0_DENTH